MVKRSWRQRQNFRRTDWRKGNNMDRRRFLGAAIAVVAATALRPSEIDAEEKKLKPMALGLLVKPFGAPKLRFASYMIWASRTAFSLSMDISAGSHQPLQLR